MSEQRPETGPQDDHQSGGQAERQAAEQAGEQQVVIVGPDGQPIGTMPASALAMAGAVAEAGGVGEDGPDGEDDGGRPLTELVEQPAKVMRVGSMVRQLLEEVRSAPLDDASRVRLREIHQASITELEAGLAPELVEELERLSLPFTDDSVPSDAELRVAQAQLVGWLEGLFHGIQTAIYAQQMAAKAQMEQVRRALPGGLGGQPGQPGPAGQPGQAGQRPVQPGRPGGEDGHGSGGMYL